MNHLRPALELNEIQGNILQGYHMKYARHFAVCFGERVTAGRFLSDVIDGELKVTTAAPWSEPPRYCVNIGLTAKGLAALGVPDGTLRLFPDVFRKGPAVRARGVGDVGESGPDKWIFGRPGQEVHAVLSLYAVKATTDPEHDDKGETIQRVADDAKKLLERHDIRIVKELAAEALPGDVEHFGYKDGIAQPNIEGIRGVRIHDRQPPANVGEFLLGKNYVNQYGGNFIGDLPQELADNATYGAFRMMKQDVFGFREFIERVAKKQRIPPELVKAQLLGRWPDGTPLSLAPTTKDLAKAPRDPLGLNDFDYAPPRKDLPKSPRDPLGLNDFDSQRSDRDLETVDDLDGVRCPVNAHIRRMNPRGAPVMGKPYTRRLIRRNLTYGPAAAPHVKRDDEKRGLMGFFFCGDLDMQFEFLLRSWANMDIHAAGARGFKDPLIGAQDQAGGRFMFRTEKGKEIEVGNLPRFVTTRGSLYCFVPSIRGLRFLSRVAAATS